MPTDDQFTLSKEGMDVFRTLAEDARSGRSKQQPNIPVGHRSRIEIYHGITTSIITAYTAVGSGTGTGTGTGLRGAGDLGSGTVEIRGSVDLASGAVSAYDAGWSVTAYNIRTTAIAKNTRVVMGVDGDGKFIVVAAGSDGGGGGGISAITVTEGGGSVSFNFPPYTTLQFGDSGFSTHLYANPNIGGLVVLGAAGAGIGGLVTDQLQTIGGTKQFYGAPFSGEPGQVTAVGVQTPPNTVSLIGDANFVQDTQHSGAVEWAVLHPPTLPFGGLVHMSADWYDNQNVFNQWGSFAVVLSAYFGNSQVAAPHYGVNKTGTPEIGKYSRKPSGVFNAPNGLHVFINGTYYPVLFRDLLSPTDDVYFAYIAGGVVCGVKEAAGTGTATGTGTGGSKPIQRFALGTASGSGSGFGNVTVTLSGVTVDAGTKLIVSAGRFSLGGGSTGIVSLTFAGTAMNKDIESAGIVVSGNRARDSVWSLTVGSTTTGDIVLTYSPGSLGTSAACFTAAFIANLRVNAFDQSASNTGSNSAPDTGATGNTTASPEYYQSSFGYPSGTAPGAGGGFTLGQSTFVSLGLITFNLQETFKIDTAAAPQNPDASLTSTTPALWAAALATYK
jgi:hypothetical protein